MYYVRIPFRTRRTHVTPDSHGAPVTAVHLQVATPLREDVGLSLKLVGAGSTSLSVCEFDVVQRLGPGKFRQWSWRRGRHSP